jgi:hypothetical protein
VLGSSDPPVLGPLSDESGRVRPIKGLVSANNGALRAGAVPGGLFSISVAACSAAAVASGSGRAPMDSSLCARGAGKEREGTGALAALGTARSPAAPTTATPPRACGLHREGWEERGARARDAARAARRVARRAGSTGPGTWTMVECPMIELYCQ